MQRIDGRFVYAASDLNNFLECNHLTELDRLVAGKKSAPEREDPQAELIARKGDEHEKRYLGELRDRHAGAVTEFDRPEHSIAGFEAAAEQTIAAMERGDRLIYQGTFFDGLLGFADFLRRVDVPCERWAWSYEVIDTKLALNTKPYFHHAALQLQRTPRAHSRYDAGGRLHCARQRRRETLPAE